MITSFKLYIFNLIFRRIRVFFHFQINYLLHLGIKHSFDSIIFYERNVLEGAPISLFECFNYNKITINDIRVHIE